MNGIIFYILLALAAGFCLPTQAGINAQLNLWTRSPVLAATISFAVGTLALILYAVVTRISMPSLQDASGHPWWIWTGGLLGAFFVAATVILVPRLGATSMLGLILAGQLIASLVLDHFGLLGYAVQPITPGRLLGVAFLAAGVVLVRLY